MQLRRVVSGRAAAARHTAVWLPLFGQVVLVLVAPVCLCGFQTCKLAPAESHLISAEAGLQVPAGQVADAHPLAC